MKKLYQIDEFFPAEGDQRFSLSAESPLDQVTYNIFSADDFADAAIYEYGERKCLFPETDTPLSSFYARFARWKAQRGADIAAAFGVLKAEYNPLQNYDSTETHTGTETGLKTPTNWKDTTVHSVSQDYKETESQKPTNWTETIEHSVSQDYKETESQIPSNWEETITHAASLDYKETDSQKPTNWKETKKTMGASSDANSSGTENRIIPFNAVDFASVSQTIEQHSFDEEVGRTGTYDTEHTQTGTRTDTKAQTGTFDVERTQEGTKTEEKTQSGTFDVEKTQTGKRTDETTQSGTFDVEKTQTGTKTDERTQSGTFDTERTQTGTRTEETTQTGTFEDKMTYNTVVKKSGNIGVTTSQQMAQSELTLRATQFIRDVIKEFFDIVSVYA